MKKIAKEVALEFTAGLPLAIEKLLEERYPFEIIGHKNVGILILPEDVAEFFKDNPPFECKEIKIVSLSHLPREKANEIRKRHLKFFNHS